MGRREELARWITQERDAIRIRLKKITTHWRSPSNDLLKGWESIRENSEAPLEQAQQELLREEQVSAYARLSLQAKTLDEAWESLQRGRYGICRECGQQIPRRRLKAVPGAAFCVSCQEQREVVSRR